MRSRGFRLEVFGCIALLLAACGSSTPTISTTPRSGYQSRTIGVSTVAGDVIASQEIEPEGDSALVATGPDGTVYELAIPAFALTDPTTISIRPLKPVAIPGGQLVAGVELGPEGRTFMLPVSLKITPASSDTANLVPFQYTGSPGAAVASLAGMKAFTAGSVELWLEHFSGAFVAKAADAQSDSNWAAIPPAPLDGTAAERSAWAQAVIVAAQFDLDRGLRPDMKADDQTLVDHAWDILVKAEVETAGEKGIQDKVKAGRIEDAAVVTAGLTAMGRKAIERARKASPCDPGATIGNTLQPVLDARDEYFKNVIKNLDADKNFQQILTDGKLADYKSMERLMATFIGSMRQTQLLGRTSETDELMNARVQEWTHTYGLNLVSKTVPSTTADWQKIIAVMRQAAFRGDEAVLQAAPCIPPPGMTCPPHGDLLPLLDGAQLAEVNVCAGASATPRPVELEGTLTGQQTSRLYHGTVTAHVKVRAPLGLDSYFAQDGGTITWSGAWSPDPNNPDLCYGSGTAEGILGSEFTDGPAGTSGVSSSAPSAYVNYSINDGPVNTPGGPAAHGTELVVQMDVSSSITGTCPAGIMPILGIGVFGCTPFVLAKTGPGAFSGKCHYDDGSNTVDWSGEFH